MDTKPIGQPATLTFFAPTFQQATPVGVDFFLILTVNLERDGRGELEAGFGAAVQGGEGLRVDGEVDREDFAGWLFVGFLPGLLDRGNSEVSILLQFVSVAVPERG